MDIRKVAIAAAFILAAPAAFAQTGQRSTNEGLNAKDQERTTAIPTQQPANPGGKPMPSAGERLKDHVEKQNDMTTGTQKQGPVVTGGKPNPSASDLRNMNMGTQKDQERTTAIPK